MRELALLDGSAAQRYARASGLLYLVIIVLGLSGEALIRASLVVFGDPAETARRISAAQGLWRLGIAAQLVLLVCAIGMTFTWYLLLRPVHGRIALLAAMFGVVSLAVESLCALYLHAALSALTSAVYFPAAALAQLQLQAYLNIVAHANAFGVALVFFGVQCMLVGYLIRRAAYLPSALGVGMQIVGACYVFNSFARILDPALAAALFPWILLPCLVGEGALCLWLLVKGIDHARWPHAAGASRLARGMGAETVQE